MSEDFNRREFLKLTGAGATLLGTYGLIGCSGLGPGEERGSAAVRTSTVISGENSKSGSSNWAPRNNAGGEEAPA